MKLIPFLSKSSETTTWPWHCGTTSPRTLSFRADNNEPKKSYHHHLNFTIDQYYSPDDENVEKLIKGLRSERLFFEPGQTSSKLEEEEALDDTTPIHIAPSLSLVKESVAMSVESTDPFVDFRRSMEEMVTAHHHEEDNEGLMKVLDWEFLEDLLTCYLKMNGKSNHGYIVGAFVDLLVSLSTHQNPDKSQAAAIVIASSSSSSSSSDENCLLSSSCTNTHSFTSPLSFCSSICSTSPCLSFPLQEAQEEIENSAI